MRHQKNGVQKEWQDQVVCVQASHDGDNAKMHRKVNNGVGKWQMGMFDEGGGGILV